MEKYTNSLIHESSPYLLQHAHNPVNWISWSNEVYDIAKRENKMVLVSVGYSACHWCHVMEHECFEDEEVAALMNKFFINVKVDREERPDVDQVYMTAVQLMTNRGGWPLNCFTLPDGRPIYGGTYFPKEQWMHILRSLQYTYENDYAKVLEYAENLQKGIQRHELIDKPAEVSNFQNEKLVELVSRWSKSFDGINGGETRAPKFPLPTNYDFLLEYGIQSGNERALNHVKLSLDRMAMGGIYDQIGGGFARYSVDMLWKIPHFEKMLYDNGQLLELYAKAYAHFKDDTFLDVVCETTNWLERELLNKDGSILSAIDADSEGVEGKFYIWTKEELGKSLTKEEFNWAQEYYNVNQLGYWEDDFYVLIRSMSKTEFAKKKEWTEEELYQKVDALNTKLYEARSKRIKPGVDDKVITSWNAMCAKGFFEAYLRTGDDRYRVLGRKVVKFIAEKQLISSGRLWRTFKNGESKIEGFLDDYAFTIQAFIWSYFSTHEELWLENANLLLKQAILAFGDETTGMFFFTASDSELIARKMELNDNVIPSSNSIMALNLFILGKIYHNNAYINRSEQMLANVYDGMEQYGSGYSNWAKLLNYMVNGFYEIVCTGEKAQDNALKLYAAGISNSIIVWNSSESELPIFADKSSANSAIYICKEGVCHAPFNDVTDAIKFVIQ